MNQKQIYLTLKQMVPFINLEQEGIILCKVARNHSHIPGSMLFNIVFEYD